MQTLIVKGAERGIDEIDLKHGADLALKLDQVAHAERMRGEQEQPACQVGKTVLHRERERQTDCAERGEQRSRWDAERGGAGENEQRIQRDLDRGAEERVKRRVEP